MLDKVSQNRILIIYGNELVDYEQSVSGSFARLTECCGWERPPAELVHRQLRHVPSDAALVSLIFFPSQDTPSSIARAGFLKEQFDVADASILNDRKLRNHLFHLDERLDRWAMVSKTRTYGRAMIGSRKDAERAGVANEDLLGIFDTKKLTFSFLENDLQVDDLVGEIRRIAHIARKKTRDLIW